MELYVGGIGAIAAVFVVIFGGRGLIDLARGYAERRRSRSTRGNAVPATPRLAQTQEVRFTTAADGTRIAYATAGEGPPLVNVGTLLTHLEFDWASPIWRPWWGELSKDHTLVRYDMRGCGLSDWDVEDLSHEARVTDLEAVVDALDLQEFSLLGPSMGGPVAVEYSLRHPERVSHLVLYAPHLTGRLTRGGPPEEMEARWTLMRLGWGSDDPRYRQLLIAQMIPEATAEQRRALNELARACTSPDNAVRINQATSTADHRDLAARVTVPTLVLHGRDDRSPYERSRDFAAAVPGARFVLLETANHILVQGEPAWDAYLSELRRFIDSPSPG